MKNPIRYQALYAASLFALALSGPAHAELRAVKQQAVVEDAIVPEDAGEEVVVVKKKPAKKVVRVVEEDAPDAAPATNANSNSAQAVAIAQAAPAEKASMGTQLDAGIKNKMADVQTQFENAMLKTLDRIKITVDDGSAPQGAAAPTQTAVVQDNIVANNSAVEKGGYMGVESAPQMNDDEASGGTSVSDLEKSESNSHKVRVAPIIGKTTIGSNYYNVESGTTLGVELEMDVDTNFSVVLGYQYAKYDIGLASGNPFYGYYQGYGYNLGSSQTLGYNQNMFTGVGRLYLMPPESKFRVYGGAGVGYNLGYLNYRQNNNNYLYNPYATYNGVSDYEVKSWLGILEAGAGISVSKNVSLGAEFRYALIFNSSENAPLNNYAFGYSGYNYNHTPDQAAVGGSLADQSFYSILGTVKVAF